MSTVRKIQCFVGLIYACQVFAAFYCHFVPIADRKKEGRRYIARYGGPLPSTLMPVLGAMQFIWINVTIYDLKGKKIESRGLDVASDIYDVYRDVWPEKKEG